jgi:hypothetical protein
MAAGQRRLDGGLAHRQPVEGAIEFLLVDRPQAEFGAETGGGGVGRERARRRPIHSRAISCVDTQDGFSRIISRASHIPIQSAGTECSLGLPKGGPDQANGGAR